MMYLFIPPVAVSVYLILMNFTYHWMRIIDIYIYIVCIKTISYVLLLLVTNQLRAI